MSGQNGITSTETDPRNPRAARPRQSRANRVPEAVGHLIGACAMDPEEAAGLMNDYLAGRAFRYAATGALEYAEDFDREWRATIRDPEGRAALTYAYQQARQAGKDAGGQRCCGTTAEWHRPWCKTGPRRYRTEAAT